MDSRKSDTRAELKRYEIAVQVGDAEGGTDDRKSTTSSPSLYLICALRSRARNGMLHDGQLLSLLFWLCPVLSFRLSMSCLRLRLFRRMWMLELVRVQEQEGLQRTKGGMIRMRWMRLSSD